MAIVYFRTNADSGDGSLRAAYAAAAPGDAIMPDPAVDWGTETIVITLAAKLSLSKSATFDGGAFRVRLDAQSGCGCIENGAGSTVAFRRFDFVRGHNPSGGGCYHSSASASKATFTQCLFAGGYSGNYGGAIYLYGGSVVLRDCVVTGGRSSSNVGGIRVYTNAKSFTATRCTIVGNAGTDLSLLTSGGAAYSLADNIVGTGSSLVEKRAPSSVGFVQPPPDALDAKDWNAELWRAFDLRLRHDSACLTGSTSVTEDDVDFLGHNRRNGGALGAYEGSWLVLAPGQGERVVGNVRVDRVELADGSRVGFAPDASLAIVEGGTIGAAEFVADASAYLATSPGVDASCATLVGVTLCEYGACVSAFTATAVSPKQTELRWTSEDATRTVLLEAYRGGGWTPIGSVAGERFLTRSQSGRTRYRLFDGSTYYYDDAWTFHGVQFRVVSSWATAERPSRHWEAIVQTASTTAKVSPGQSLTILARIFDAFDVDAALLNDGENVTAVRYSCYYNTNNLFEQDFKPVEGHADVAADTSCVLEALQKSDAWTRDDVGYNFVLAPDVREHALFPTPGDYRIKVAIELKQGNPIVFYVPVAVEERA